MTEFLFLFAPLVFALMVGLPVGFLLWIARRQETQRKSQRGFDVASEKASDVIGAMAKARTNPVTALPQSRLGGVSLAIACSFGMLGALLAGFGYAQQALPEDDMGRIGLGITSLFLV